MTRAAGARNRNFMKLIERYLFRQLLGPTLAASAALAGVALLSSSLGQLELIVDQGQSATVFATLTLLALPQLLSLVLPIAIFVASLIALNRLQTEQELVVCFASGMSRWRVIAPVVRLAAVVALLILALNLFVQPVAARTVREQMFQIRTDLAATLIREGDFSTPSGELTVYAQRTERDGRLLNIFIHEERPQGPRTVIAKEGRLVQRAAGPALLLRVGSSEEYDSSGVLNFTQFSLNTFDLAPFVNTEEKLHYKISDRWMHELVFPDLRHDWERHNRTKMLAEANSRLAAALYSFTFVMLALSAVVGGPVQPPGLQPAHRLCGRDRRGHPHPGLRRPGGLQRLRRAQRAAVRHTAGRDVRRLRRPVPPPLHRPDPIRGRGRADPARPDRRLGLALP
jgi:lipopolysaccharide export system permease protein